MHDFRIIVGAMALVASVAGGAGAQQAAGSSPWRAWLGCWSGAEGGGALVDMAQPLVCVSPTASAETVRITTLADGKVVSTQTLDASGREVPIDAKGCTGTQTGRWSADGRRVYLSARATCDGVAHTSTGIVGMSPVGEWIDVQGVLAGDDERIRVARYRSAPVRGDVPAEVAASLGDSELAVVSARGRAGSTIGSTAVVEAARFTSVGVTEAFVMERGQRFELDASQLVALAEAGVSTRLTDAMIAISNPRHFAVRTPDRGALDTGFAGRRVYVTLDRMSPWGWGDRYGYGRYGYDRYGYDSYGYNGYGYGSGYGGYGYGYGGPVIIVPAGEARPKGRMVRGEGYKQPAGASGGDRRTARERPAPDASRQPSSSAGTRSSGSGSSGDKSGSSSSGSSERTAKPRP